MAQKSSLQLMTPSFFLSQANGQSTRAAEPVTERWSLSENSEASEEEKAESVHSSVVNHDRKSSVVLEAKQQQNRGSSQRSERSARPVMPKKSPKSPKSPKSKQSSSSSSSGKATPEMQARSHASQVVFDRNFQQLEIQRRLTGLVSKTSIKTTREQQKESLFPQMEAKQPEKKAAVSFVESAKPPPRAPTSQRQICLPLSYSSSSGSEQSQAGSDSIFETDERQTPKRVKKVSKNNLDLHLRSYKESFQKKLDPEHSFDLARRKIIDSKIQAVKYNYSLEEKVQDYKTYECELFLSEDGKHFLVDLFKPKVNLSSNLRSDRDQKEPDSNKQAWSSGQPGGQPSDYTEVSIKKKRSSASCKVADIQGFTLGPQCSRFWMFRKHINSIPLRRSHEVPFFAWECLTLHLKNRSLDLVIRNEEDMRTLLWFLVPTLKTIDGQRDSAASIISSAITADRAKLGQAKASKVVRGGAGALQRKWRTIEFLIYERAVKSCKLLIIRNKISYHAQLKGQTVMELFFRTILKTVYSLADKGMIELNREQDKAFDKIFSPVDKKDYFGQRFMVMSTVIKALGAKSEKEYQYIPENIHNYFTEKKNYNSINNISKDFIRKYFEKDGVLEIFRDLPQANENVDNFEYWNFNRFFNYKVGLKCMNTLLRRTRLFVALGLMKGLLYLKIMIRRIELKKERLVLEVEQGKDVFIDRELSSNRLPASFRFYDFLLRYIAENVADHRKEFFGMKTSLSMALQKKDQMSIFDEEAEKLVFRVKHKDQSRQHEIDHIKSEHTMGVQRSNYVCIDNSLTRVTRRSIDMPKTLLEQRARPQSIGNVKYSLSRSVARNQRDYLKFKSTYAVKQGHIKSQGQKIQLVDKTASWIESHLLPTLVAQANPPLSLFQQEQLRKNLQKLAESLVSQQRIRHEAHLLARIKELFFSEQDSSSKMAIIDKIITYDHKYFEPTSSEQQEAFSKIQAQHKRVEKRIQRRQTLFLDRRRNSAFQHISNAKTTDTFKKSPLFNREWKQ